MYWELDSIETPLMKGDNNWEAYRLNEAMYNEWTNYRVITQVDVDIWLQRLSKWGRQMYQNAGFNTTSNQIVDNEIGYLRPMVMDLTEHYAAIQFMNVLDLLLLEYSFARIRRSRV